MLKLTQSFTTFFFLNKRNLLLTTFIIASIIRLLLIFNSRPKDNWIDLSIYRNGGQLVARGINPYDYNDGLPVRNQLRLDSIASNSWVDETQEKWDYYVSSNLPLSLIYYGLIDILSNSSPLFYRIVFALFDSILSALIALILFKYWQLKKKFVNLLLILGMGALSPSLLFWGTTLPEDKGVQILLMLLAIYFARERKIFISSIFLGCSVAFKGLGIFIFPICLYLIIGEPEKISIIDRRILRRGLFYLLLSLLFAGIWFVPYLPDIITMIRNRLDSNLGALSEPAHASIWIFVFNSFPDNWALIKTIILILISVIWFYAFTLKKFDIYAISLFLLVLFVDLLLLQGGLDRMNIGIVVSVTCFFFLDIRYSKILAWYTIIAGILWYTTLNIRGSANEIIDARFVTGYVLLFTFYPFYNLFIKNKLADSN